MMMIRMMMSMMMTMMTVTMEMIVISYQRLTPSLPLHTV